MTFNKKYLIFGIVLILSLGIGTFVYAQTTVNKDFNFSDTNYIYSLQGLSIGTSTTNSNSITFSDGTIFNQNNAAAAWTTDSTGIHYNSGNVGIGVTDPNSKLDVNGAVYGTIFYDKDNTSYYINPSGTSQLGAINWGDSGKNRVRSESFNWSGSQPEVFMPVIDVSGGSSVITHIDVSGCNFTTATTFLIQAYWSSSTYNVNVWSLGDKPNQLEDELQWYAKYNSTNDYTVGLSVKSGNGCSDSGLTLSTYLDGINFSTNSSDTNVSNYNAVGFSRYLYENMDDTASLGNTLDMNSNKIINLAGPASDSDAATKSYVDSTVSGGTTSNAESCNADGTCEINVVDADSTGAHVFGSGNNTITLDPGGSSLLDISTPNGAYDGILLDMDDDQGSNNFYALNVRLSDSPQDHTDNTNTKFLVNAQGNLLLNRGTTLNTSYWLDVNGNVRFSGDGSNTTLNINNSPDSNGSVAAINANGMTLGDNELDGASALHLNHNSSGDVLMVNAGGAVGIGNSSPSSKLDVNGNIEFSGMGTNIYMNNYQIYDGGNFYADTYYDDNNTSYYANPSSRSHLDTITTPNKNFGGDYSTTPGRNNGISLGNGGGEGFTMFKQNPGSSSSYCGPNDYNDCYIFMMSDGNTNYESGAGILFARNDGDGNFDPLMEIEQEGRINMKNNPIRNITGGIDITGNGDISNISELNAAGGSLHLQHVDSSSRVEVGADSGGVTLDLNSNDIVNVDKLDANTVDPIYNIEDSKYATYMAGMTGVKEETTGSVTLTKENQDYTHTIDFQELEKGSDLWIFYQTSDFGENWNNFSVLLTGDASVKDTAYYKLLPKEEKLVFYGDDSGRVSYRLTAPRFDHDKWDNNYEGESEGLTVPAIK